MKFDCPHCRQNLEAERDMEGQPIACPKCGKKTHVPVSTSAVSTAALIQETRRGVQAIETTQPDQPRPVVITDIQMSIWSLIVLLFKLSIAGIIVGIFFGVIIFILSMTGCSKLISYFLVGAPHP